MFRCLNKRGQGLSTNAIILIILGVIVLAILILGFTMGWGKLKDIISPSNNVKDIVDGCNVACTTQGIYDYCSKERVLKSDDLPTGEKEVKGNCTYFAVSPDYKRYGVKPCIGLCE